MKKIIYIFGVVILVAWIVYRIFAISSESARDVFNPFRAAAQNGLSVEMVTVEQKTGILKEPVFIKNNRASVSCGRVHKFKIGQKVGTGEIVSVSSKIDIDTGMCIIKTRGTVNGTTFAEAVHTGFFIPVYAVKDGAVMISQDGTVVSRPVRVSSVDAEHALVTDGLHNGDNVILSDVDEGSKIK